MAQIGMRKGDNELILALASGATVAQAAERAGISTRTAYRRLDEAGIGERIEEARAGMFARAVGRLAETATHAADRLASLMHSTSDSVSLGACRAALELGQRLRDANELELRLRVLEKGHESTKSNHAT